MRAVEIEGWNLSAACIGPLAGGFIAGRLGYPTVFGVSIAFLAAGLVLLILMVKEPRTARLAAI